MRNEKCSGKKTGKYRRKQSKNIALILALILLLGMTIGGTVAYLVSDQVSVVNDFIPANVEIEIQEEVANNVKEKIVIKNKSNIPVYIRVALVGNWADAEGKICINHSAALPEFTLGENWVKGSDGFFYYTQSVAAEGSTGNLLGSGIGLNVAEDGCSYQLEVIASAIQAQGELDDGSQTAVANAWGLDPASLQ